MKTYIIKTILTTSIIGLFMTSCNNSPTAKEADVKEATEDLIDAEADLDQAEFDSINDFNTFKESIQIKLAENQSVINDLKSKISSKGKVNRDIDEVEINKLEKRNTELKLKIENYEQGPEQKWALFKVDFNNELDDLGKSISNMADRNKKK
ncbi:hypothetical protein M9Q43_08310 [Flavobacterium sp. HXWNR29]|uniref:hypothetical protein n=1 Tax=Flavobacterium odoriferum TaxID=2946604 RepID=UPI0021CB09DF|nr:hypothetical protein [Flavobacterium sp. HXWNR29]MCU4189164.1 hypothetical protein [Flavobacterium sp. HXWNR29]